MQASVQTQCGMNRSPTHLFFLILCYLRFNFSDSRRKIFQVFTLSSFPHLEQLLHWTPTMTPWIVTLERRDAVVSRDALQWREHRFGGRHQSWSQSQESRKRNSLTTFCLFRQFNYGHTKCSVQKYIFALLLWQYKYGIKNWQDIDNKQWLNCRKWQFYMVLMLLHGVNQFS